MYCVSFFAMHVNRPILKFWSLNFHFLTRRYESKAVNIPDLLSILLQSETSTQTNKQQTKLLKDFDIL